MNTPINLASSTRYRQTKRRYLCELCHYSGTGFNWISYPLVCWSLIHLILRTIIKFTKIAAVLVSIPMPIRTFHACDTLTFLSLTYTNLIFGPVYTDHISEPRF